MYLIAGGPSLDEFPWDKLRGEPCIAITRSFERAPWADVLYFTDARFWEWYHAELSTWKGNIVTAAKPARIHPTFPRMEFYKLTMARGLDLRPNCLRHGNSSGYAAINLAVHLGAKRIYLLGYDMKFKDGKSHHHGGHPVRNTETVFTKMLPFFPSIVEPLKKHGIEVLNANPDSAIECFPKIHWEELPCW